MSEESLRDRLASLSRRELIGLVAVGVATLAGGAFWYVRSLPKPVEVSTDIAGGAAAAPATSGAVPAGGVPVIGPSGAPASPEAVIIVDVAGWVRKPGVYEFQTGDRVIDAIRAAGGERPGASLEALNLAAPLADGAQILVPKQAPVGASVPGVPTGAPAGASGATAKINVNTADATQLEELPGIGEVLAQAIIDYRTDNGPFTSVDELEDVSGIGPSTLEDIREQVIV